MASFHASGNTPLVMDQLIILVRGAASAFAPSTSCSWVNPSLPELFFSFDLVPKYESYFLAQVRIILRDFLSCDQIFGTRSNALLANFDLVKTVQKFDLV